MQSDRDDTLESYCLHCLEPAGETSEACVGCHTPFVGSGAFQRVRGPGPSALFTKLFATAPTECRAA